MSCLLKIRSHLMELSSHKCSNNKGVNKRMLSHCSHLWMKDFHRSKQIRHVPNEYILIITYPRLPPILPPPPPPPKYPCKDVNTKWDTLTKIHLGACEPADKALNSRSKVWGLVPTACHNAHCSEIYWKDIIPNILCSILVPSHI